MANNKTKTKTDIKRNLAIFCQPYRLPVVSAPKPSRVLLMPPAVAVLAEKLVLRCGRKTPIDLKVPNPRKAITKRANRTIHRQGWGCLGWSSPMVAMIVGATTI